MRLTLRNLLAYLDGILEPQDAQDLSKKIEESKFAGDLMHRIRDLMRRMRLAAPSTSERGPGLDPNTVAEYLDNTLPADRVTDFEKVCLEPNTTMADIHLAEVAACHQVLTIVLGEPAEIDPAARERIYQLPFQAKQPEPAPHAHATTVPPPIPTQPSQQPYVPQDFLDLRSRTKPTVPEYLREPQKKRPWFAIAAGTLVVMCLLLLVLNLSQQFEKDSWLGKKMISMGLVSPKTEVVSTANGKKEESTTKDDADKTSASETKSTSEKEASESEKMTVAEENPNQNNITPPVQPAVNGPGGENPAIPPVPQNPPQDVPPAGENNQDQKISELTNTTPGVTAPVGENTLPNDQAATMPSNNNVAVTANNLPIPANPADIPAPAQNPIGRFTSLDPQILLRSNGDSGEWERAPDKAILYPQQHLLALPTYRPAITLTSNLMVQLLGGTEVTLLPEDKQLPSGIRIRYGQVVINSVANPGTRLRLVIGEQTYVLTFLDPDSNVGIEVRRIPTVGTNPEDETPRVITEIFVTKDRIALDDGTGKPLEIAAPTLVHLWPQFPPVTDHAKDFPRWIASAESISDLDRRGAQVILQSFTPETPAEQKLLELADPQQRLIEARRLAIRSLGYLGDFDRMVSALNDVNCKNDWQDKYFEWLREAVKRDPQTAAAVREALEKNFSPQATNLYRMLWGYTDKDLVAGEDATLVKNLDDDHLAVRVLAICNLKNITEKDLGYRADGTIPRRDGAAKIWKQRLDAKEIRNKQTDKKTAPAIPEVPPTSLVPPPPTATNP